MAHPETVPETNVKETGGTARNGDILGYARVSTAAQDAAAKRRGKKARSPQASPRHRFDHPKLIEAGLTPGDAAKQLGLGRTTAYGVAQALY